MATAPGVQRDVVEFAPNTPVQIALKFATGKFITTRNNEQRVMFTLTDDRVMFLDPGPADTVNQLGARPGEPIVICKKWSGKRNERAEWTAWLSTAAEKQRAIEEAKADGSDLHLVSQLADSIHQVRMGQQKDGTFVVPGGGAGNLDSTVNQRPDSPGQTRSATTPPSRQAQQQQLIDNGHDSASWSDCVLADTNALVDLYAVAWQHAKKYEGAIKPEEVRNFITTVYIQLRRGWPYA